MAIIIFVERELDRSEMEVFFRRFENASFIMDRSTGSIRENRIG